MTESSAAPRLDWPLYGARFGEAVQRGFTKYATFDGRASRSEFWWWYLFNIGAAVALLILFCLASLVDPYLGAFVSLVWLAFWIGTLLPSLAVTVRRLHDSGHSGWAYFVTFIPLVGNLIFTVYLASDTSPRAVWYGPPGPEGVLGRADVRPETRTHSRGAHIALAVACLFVLVVGAVGIGVVRQSGTLVSSSASGLGFPWRTGSSGYGSDGTDVTDGDYGSGSGDRGVDPSDEASTDYGSGGASATPEPTETESEEPDPYSEMPKGPDPLPDNMMVVRRNDDGDWKIETITATGDLGDVLVRGHENWGTILTPDRRTALYLNEVAGVITLRAVGVDGSGDTALFRDGTSDCPRLGQPALSAEGLLAIACLDGKHRPGALTLMTLDGEVVRVLDTGRVGDPTFTNDGQTVIYFRSVRGDAEGGSIYQVQADGSSEPEVLMNGYDGEYSDVVCSPVDSRVAYTRRQGARTHLYTFVPGTDQPPVKLTTGDVLDKGTSWSPDGSQVAFRRGDNAQSSIYVADADGSGEHPILKNRGYLASPNWTAH